MNPEYVFTSRELASRRLCDALFDVAGENNRLTVVHESSAATIRAAERSSNSVPLMIGSTITEVSIAEFCVENLLHDPNPLEKGDPEVGKAIINTRNELRVNGVGAGWVSQRPWASVTTQNGRSRTRLMVPRMTPTQLDMAIVEQDVYLDFLRSMAAPLEVQFDHALLEGGNCE